VLIAAALREGYTLPLFIQGDHCQVNAKKYQADAPGELGEVMKLIAEEVGAGFYNIDVDTSTLVDLSKPNLDEQQRLNYQHAAEITRFIRDREPEGVTVSVGAEIGEVGHKNSTVEELHAFMQGYNRSLKALGDCAGISKISVQTGTSHGGVVLPDGTIADVKLDLEALAALSKVSREQYGLAGAVQHGASTLPSTAFGNFPRIETCEIHLATNFQNIVFDHPKLPKDLVARIKPWLKENAQSDFKAATRTSSSTTRRGKRRSGPSRRSSGPCRTRSKAAIVADLEKTFGFLFEQLNVNGYHGTGQSIRARTGAAARRAQAGDGDGGRRCGSGRIDDVAIR
jgi:fructose/tagatose bisphosphate aldolase